MEAITSPFEDLDRCEHHIAAALEYAGGTHTVEDVKRKIFTGQLQFWPGKNSMMVTEIEIYPQMKCCHVFLCAGDMAEIHEMRKSVEEWAWRRGCSMVTLAGRKGWLRELSQHGYAPKWYVMAKDLYHGQGK